MSQSGRNEAERHMAKFDNTDHEYPSCIDDYRFPPTEQNLTQEVAVATKILELLQPLHRCAGW